MCTCIQVSVPFVNDEYYLTFPHSIHTNRRTFRYIYEQRNVVSLKHVQISHNTYIYTNTYRRCGTSKRLVTTQTKTNVQTAFSSSSFRVHSIPSRYLWVSVWIFDIHNEQSHQMKPFKRGLIASDSFIYLNSSNFDWFTPKMAYF